MPARKLATGTVLVEVAPAEATANVALYARVSSHDQRADLEQQLGRLVAWAAGQGMNVSHTVAEVGSGMNGARPKLRRLLADASGGTIVMRTLDDCLLAGRGRSLRGHELHWSIVTNGTGTSPTHTSSSTRRGIASAPRARPGLDQTRRPGQQHPPALRPGPGAGPELPAPLRAP